MTNQGMLVNKQNNIKSNEFSSSTAAAAAMALSMDYW